MEALYFMIPITFLLSGSALAACLWAISKGQYDDMETPPLRLFNEELNNVKQAPNNNEVIKMQ